MAQDQAAAAEQKRATAEKASADKASTDKASAAPAAADKAVNLAALSDSTAPADVTKSVQTELRRVGCLTGSADGEWNSGAQRSLTLFNRYAGTKLDTKLASTDTLDVIKQKTSRVCPLVCEHGFKADGDRCSKITCAEGSFLNDDNECEKRREKKPVAKRDDDDDRRDRRTFGSRAAGAEARDRQALAGVRCQSPATRALRHPLRASGSQGQPLTGREREVGCNGYGAIMSGKCP